MARERGTGDEETIQEGGLVVEERMNRREGLVEYEGTVETAGTTTDAGPAGKAGGETGLLGGGAMQAGATILGGTGSTAKVDDATTVGMAPGGGDAATAGRDPLSMSTDNTTAGMMTADTVEGGPIAQVREGMTVVDAGGDDVGKVTFVKMGDPAAATTAGEAAGDDGSVLDDAGSLFFGDDDPDLPETFRNELLRVGYVKIDAKGWFGRDRYAAADQIAGVSGETVRLSVAKDALPS